MGWVRVESRNYLSSADNSVVVLTTEGMTGEAGRIKADEFGLVFMACLVFYPLRSHEQKCPEMELLL